MLVELIPIYLRLTVDGESIEMSTQRECDPEKWDRKSRSAIGIEKENPDRELNNYLERCFTENF